MLRRRRHCTPRISRRHCTPRISHRDTRTRTKELTHSAQRAAYSTAGHHRARLACRHVLAISAIAAGGGPRRWRKTANGKGFGETHAPDGLETQSGTFIAESPPSTCCTNGPASTLVQICEPMQIYSTLGSQSNLKSNRAIQKKEQPKPNNYAVDRPLWACSGCFIRLHGHPIATLRENVRRWDFVVVDRECPNCQFVYSL